MSSSGVPEAKWIPDHEPVESGDDGFSHLDGVSPWFETVGGMLIHRRPRHRDGRRMIIAVGDAAQIEIELDLRWPISDEEDCGAV